MVGKHEAKTITVTRYTTTSPSRTDPVTTVVPPEGLLSPSDITAAVTSQLRALITTDLLRRPSAASAAYTVVSSA